MFSVFVAYVYALYLLLSKIYSMVLGIRALALRFEIVKNIKIMIEYIKQVIAEMKNVSWLSRRKTIWLTVVVMLVSVGTSMYLGFSDYVLQIGVQHIVNR